MLGWTPLLQIQRSFNSKTTVEPFLRGHQDDRPLLVKGNTSSANGWVQIEWPLKRGSTVHPMFDLHPAENVTHGGDTASCRLC